MRLYSYYRSSAAYRVRIGLELKGLEYEYVAVNLLQAQQKAGDYLAKNPQGLVPLLETDDGVLINQSVAILEWLEETHSEPALLPAEPLPRARVRSLVNTIACDIHPLNNIAATNYLHSPLNATNEQVHAWYAGWIARGFDAIEQTLEVHSSRYCFGDELSMADVFLVPQTYNAVRSKVDISAYPNIQRVCQHCNLLDAFTGAHPDNQPDAPPPH